MVKIQEDALLEGLRYDDQDVEQPPSFVLLACGLLVLFVQWVLMTFFMPFFALSGPGSKISANVQGFVFAAFPAGTAAAAPFIGKLLVKFGTRNTVLAGLGLMTVFISLFGLIPTLVAEGASMEYLLMLTGFLYGACSTLAETGTYAILTYSYPDKLVPFLTPSPHRAPHRMMRHLAAGEGVCRYRDYGGRGCNPRPCLRGYSLRPAHLIRLRGSVHGLLSGLCGSATADLLSHPSIYAQLLHRRGWPRRKLILRYMHPSSHHVIISRLRHWRLLQLHFTYYANKTAE